MSVCVFLGPSLPLPEARQLMPEAYYLPPVRQGDVYRAVQRFQPSAIAIIDGYFQQVPAVWHKEILWCLAEGIPVYGAASMGALRAAELDQLGMLGIGRVYEAYRDGYWPPYDHEDFEDDDEVAVVHGPAELDFLAVTDALVNIRCSLAQAAEQGVISTRNRDALVALAKRQYYAERKYSTLFATAEKAGIDNTQLTALKNWLSHSRIDQKREDALLLLKTINATSEPVLPEAHFEPTTLWQHMLHTSSAAFLPFSQQDKQVLQRAREDPLLWREVRQTAALHCVLAEQGKQRLEATELRAVFKEWRETQGLYTQAALERYLRDNRLNLKKLKILLENEVFLTTLISDTLLQELILDILKYRGDYARLLLQG